jgi:hypothetical protein
MTRDQSLVWYSADSPFAEYARQVFPSTSYSIDHPESVPTFASLDPRTVSSPKLPTYSPSSITESKSWRDEFKVISIAILVSSVMIFALSPWWNVLILVFFVAAAVNISLVLYDRVCHRRAHTHLHALLSTVRRLNRQVDRAFRSLVEINVLLTRVEGGTGGFEYV